VPHQQHEESSSTERSILRWAGSGTKKCENCRTPKIFGNLYGFREKRVKQKVFMGGHFDSVHGIFRSHCPETLNFQGVGDQTQRPSIQISVDLASNWRIAGANPLANRFRIMPLSSKFGQTRTQLCEASSIEQIYGLFSATSRKCQMFAQPI